MISDAGFGRGLLVCTDAMGYGSADDQRQHALQTGLLAVLDEAAEGAHLSRSEWTRQAAGDGELALLPARVPEPRVVDDFVYQLSGALARYNRDRSDAARLRLRMAVHYGLASPAANGFVGQGVVGVSRLTDSRALHVALDLSGADLAVLLSERVFQDTVLAGYTKIPIADFRRIGVQNKEYAEAAWLRVPGHDVRSLPLDGSAGNWGPAEPHPALAAPFAKDRNDDPSVTVLDRRVPGHPTSIAEERNWMNAQDPHRSTAGQDMHVSTQGGDFHQGDVIGMKGGRNDGIAIGQLRGNFNQHAPAAPVPPDETLADHLAELRAFLLTARIDRYLIAAATRELDTAEQELDDKGSLPAEDPDRRGRFMVAMHKVRGLVGDAVDIATKISAIISLIGGVR